MKKIGIFGGTFNPIHNGHLILAQIVLEKYNPDEFHFIPCKIPALKNSESLVEGFHRLNMIKSVIKYEPRFILSDIELKRGGKSFTIDTLLELKSKDNELNLIIGEDNIKDFNKWKNPEKILELAKLIVVNRGGYENQIPVQILSKEISVCRIPNIEISSSEIRRRIEQNLSIRYFVPDEVFSYIALNNLYKKEII